jgi:hypothetical protein
LSPIIIEDDYWITEESKSRFQLPGQSKPVHFNELVTMHARCSDLAKADAVRVPCQTAFTAIVSWRPWMKMGDHPGHLFANAAGRYDVGLDALPTAWQAAVRARRPQLLQDPGAPIAALWEPRP